MKWHCPDSLTRTLVILHLLNGDVYRWKIGISVNEVDSTAAYLILDMSFLEFPEETARHCKGEGISLVEINGFCWRPSDRVWLVMDGLTEARSPCKIVQLRFEAELV